MSKHMPAEERKQMILAAAMKVFSETGYIGSSVDDVAKEAGISKGAIYWHFKNKDDLFKSLLEYWTKEQLISFNENFKKSQSFIDSLLSMLTMPFDLPDENMKLVRIMMEFFAHGMEIDGMVEVFDGYYKIFSIELQKYLDFAIENGELSKELKYTHDISVLIALIFDGLYARLYIDSLTKQNSFHNHKESMKTFLTRWLKA